MVSHITVQLRALLAVSVAILGGGGADATAEPLVGQVILYAGNVCPAGWLAADGSLVSRSDYPALFAVVGETHCVGNTCPTSTVFRVPALTNRFVRGAGSASNAGSVGDRGGASVTAANLPAHAHSLDGVELQGQVYTTTSDGAIAVPSSSVVLADSNRTAIYAVGSPSTPLAAGTAVVTGQADDSTGSNETTLDPGGGILPPYTYMMYCVATGGDTAPLIEVGLTYSEVLYDAADETWPTQGSLKVSRINVSGYPLDLVDQCFQDGSGLNGILCLDKLNNSNTSGIGRPNIRFTLLGDNVCTAYAYYRTFGSNDPNPGANTNIGTTGCSGYCRKYPAELQLTGVQIANYDSQYVNNKAAIPWGDHFISQLDNANGAGSSDFTYTFDRDETGRYGFVEVDRIDERTLVFQSRNVSTDQYFYRVQAKCGFGDVPPDADPQDGFPDADADFVSYYIYYDPTIVNDGRGGDPY